MGCDRETALKNLKKIKKKKAIKDRIGFIFEKLKVIQIAPRELWKSSCAHWICQCLCGNLTIVSNSNMKRTKSCGCHRKENSKKLLEGNKNSLTHGKSNTKTYNSWKHMKQRCMNSNNKNFRIYGQRGISVCERWLHSFENFYIDMGDCPEDRSLDRINTNGNYEPSNFRWATIFEQNNNTNRNKIKRRQL